MSFPSTFPSSPMFSPSSQDITQDSQATSTQPSALWAQLLRKPGPAGGSQTPSATFPSRTPIGPQDKVNTSTKILLHDTHARLESFSERADVLVKEVAESRREVIRTREDMVAEQVKDREDLVQMVNRAQTAIQKSVGEPAQARDISDLKIANASTNDKIRILEVRLDSVAEAIKEQSRALEKVHDTIRSHHNGVQAQHTKTIELLVPLLSLLQAVPLHVETSREAVLNRLRDQDQALNKIREQEHVLDKIREQQEAMATIVSERQHVSTPSNSSPARPPLVPFNRPHLSPPTSSPAPPPSKKRKLTIIQDVSDRAGPVIPPISLLQLHTTGPQPTAFNPGPSSSSNTSQVAPNPKKRKSRAQLQDVPSSGNTTSDNSRPSTLPASSSTSATRAPSVVASSASSANCPNPHPNLTSTSHIRFDQSSERRLSGPGVAPPPEVIPPCRLAHVLDGLPIDTSVVSSDTARRGFGPTTRSARRRAAPVGLAPAPAAAPSAPPPPQPARKTKTPANLRGKIDPVNPFRQKGVKTWIPRTPPPREKEVDMLTMSASPIPRAVNGRRFLAVDGD